MTRPCQAFHVFTFTKTEVKIPLAMRDARRSHENRHGIRMRPSPAGWGRAGTHVAVAPATEAHDDDDADRAEYEEQDEGDQHPTAAVIVGRRRRGLRAGLFVAGHLQSRSAAVMSWGSNMRHDRGPRELSLTTTVSHTARPHARLCALFFSVLPKCSCLLCLRHC